VRLLLRGKGLLGEAKAEAMCIFEVKQNALRFIQVCAVDRMEVRCALDFIQG
jgi:hypothetical protein